MARFFFFLLCLELGCLAIRPTAPCVTGRLDERPPRPRPSYAVAPSGSSEDRGLEPPEDALIVAGTRLADLRAEST